MKGFQYQQDFQIDVYWNLRINHKHDLAKKYAKLRNLTSITQPPFTCWTYYLLAEMRCLLHRDIQEIKNEIQRYSNQ